MRTTMPAIAGQIARTNGSFQKIRLINCEADGTVNVTPKYGDAFTIDMLSGDDRMFEHPLPKTVEITAGTFSLA